MLRGALKPLGGGDPRTKMQVEVMVFVAIIHKRHAEAADMGDPEVG